MIARMVVGVAAQHIEANSPVEFLERVPRVRETVADQLRKVLIRSISSHHFIKAEHGESRDHRLPRPAVLCVPAVKALDQQYVLVCGTGDRYRCCVEPAGACELHRDEFSLHNAVGVVGRRKFGDEFPFAVIDKRLGARAAD